MAKNLLRRVMTASFRRAENADATNVTRRPVLAHEAITPFRGRQELTIYVPIGRQPRALFRWSAAQQSGWAESLAQMQADRRGLACGSGPLPSGRRERV